MPRWPRRYNIRPLELGVDIVIHSATKYLGGHNDLLAGVTLGGHKLLEDLNKLQRMIGAMPGPLTCFLLERGLKTFRPADGTSQPRRPGGGAGFLEKHPKVEKVWYPGLEIASGLPHRQKTDARLRQRHHFSGEGRRQGDAQVH